MQLWVYLVMAMASDFLYFKNDKNCPWIYSVILLFFYILLKFLPQLVFIFSTVLKLGG